jgi:hypothetical protein
MAYVLNNYCLFSCVHDLKYTEGCVWVIRKCYTILCQQSEDLGTQGPVAVPHGYRGLTDYGL